MIIIVTDKKNPDHVLLHRNEGSIFEEQEFGIKKTTYSSKTNLGLELRVLKVATEPIVTCSHTSPCSSLTWMKTLKSPTRLNPVATAEEKQTDRHIHLESESHEHGIFTPKPTSEESPLSWRKHHRILDNPHYSYLVPSKDKVQSAVYNL